MLKKKNIHEYMCQIIHLKKMRIYIMKTINLEYQSTRTEVNNRTKGGEIPEGFPY